MPRIVYWTFSREKWTAVVQTAIITGLMSVLSKFGPVQCSTYLYLPRLFLKHWRFWRHLTTWQVLDRQSLKLRLGSCGLGVGTTTVFTDVGGRRYRTVRAISVDAIVRSAFLVRLLTYQSAWLYFSVNAIVVYSVWLQWYFGLVRSQRSYQIGSLPPLKLHSVPCYCQAWKLPQAPYSLSIGFNRS